MTTLAAATAAVLAVSTMQAPITIPFLNNPYGTHVDYGRLPGVDDKGGPMIEWINSSFELKIDNGKPRKCQMKVTLKCDEEKAK